MPIYKDVVPAFKYHYHLTPASDLIHEWMCGQIVKYHTIVQIARAVGLSNNYTGHCLSEMWKAEIVVFRATSYSRGWWATYEYRLW